jgi:hypothetical protein
MGKELGEICKKLGIASRCLSEEEFDYYRNNHPHTEDILKSMLEISRIMNEEVIMIGGFCVHPELLGFRTIRRPSNDLDCVTNENGIQRLYEQFGDNLFQTLNYGDVFLDYNKMPFGFDVKETHGWHIPEDFYLDIKSFKIDGTNIKTISPEYLIALKARRGAVKSRIYGKDRLDTIALIVAPYFKNTLERVDLRRTSKLIREHSTMDYNNARRYVHSLQEGLPQLNKNERSIFLKEHLEFLNNLEMEYNNYN